MKKTKMTAEQIADDIASQAKPGMQISAMEVAYSYLGGSNTANSPTAKRALELLVKRGKARATGKVTLGRTKVYEILASESMRISEYLRLKDAGSLPAISTPLADFPNEERFYFAKKVKWLVTEEARAGVITIQEAGALFKSVVDMMKKPATGKARVKRRSKRTPSYLNRMHRGLQPATN